MNCPECGKPNDDDAAICQHCDHIIDASFLGDDYTDESDGPSELGEDEFEEDTPAEDEYEQEAESAPAPGSSPGHGASRRGFNSQRRSSAQPQEEEEYEDEEEYQDEEAEEEEFQDEEFRKIEEERAALRAARIKEAPPAEKTAEAETESKGGLSVEASRVSKDMEGFLGKIVAFWKGLEKADKITIAGSMAMFVFTLFPWVSIQGQGTLAGLELGGWFLMLLAACAGTLVYLRQDEHWRGKEKYILIVQAAVAGIALLFVLSKLVTGGSVQVKTAGSLLANSSTFETSIGIGLVLSLLAAIAVGAGTGIVFKEKVLKK